MELQNTKCTASSSSEIPSAISTRKDDCILQSQQHFTTYSSTEVCTRQRSGEICKMQRCCHLCTGHPFGPPHETKHQNLRNEGVSFPRISGMSHLLRPQQSDDDSDPESISVIQIDTPGPWHRIESSYHWAGLLPPDSPRVSKSTLTQNSKHLCLSNPEHPESDYGHFNLGSDQHHEEFWQPPQSEPCLWSIEETTKVQPEQQELIVNHGLKLQCTLQPSRKSLNEAWHVYQKPFVCNMPQLQATFVGEIGMEEFYPLGTSALFTSSSPTSSSTPPSLSIAPNYH